MKISINWELNIKWMEFLLIDNFREIAKIPG